MKTILVVDDQPANRDFLGTLLGYRGHRILEAADGAEALARVREGHPDLVICDILMPTMDGFDFVKQLRTEPGIARTPVVFCTAHYLEREAAALARQCGVSHVITKPAEPQAVLDTVDKLLASSAAPVEIEQPDAFQREHLRLVTDKLSRTAEDLRNTNERMAALIELNLRLASETNPQNLLEQVCLGARQLIGARHGALGVRSRESLDTTNFVTSGLAPQLAKAFGLPGIERGILGDVLQVARPYRVGSQSIAASAAGLPEGFPSVTSLLAAPVLSPSGVFGWICLTDKIAQDQFTDEDERLLAILGMQTGRIYENGSLYRRIQVHAAQLEIEIADRKQVEEEVRETKNFLASIFDNIPNSIFVKDARELRFVRVNPACESQTGYSQEEMIGKNDYDLFPGIQADHFTSIDRKALEGRQELFMVDEEITRRDGTSRIVRTKKFPILDAQGQAQYLLGMSEDITEQKLAERRLQESEQRFRQLAENIREVFWLTDPEHREVFYVSPAYEEIWGRSCQSLYASPVEWVEAIVPEDRQAVLQAAMSEQSKGAYNVEYRIVRPDGALRWVRDRAFPVTAADGSIIRIAGVAVDITEQKLAERQLRESEVKYRTLIDQASDGIFVLDAEGRFVLVNFRGRQLLGYAESELIGMDNDITYLPADRLAVTHRMEQARGGAVLRYERLVRRKDGSAFPAEFSSRMLENGMFQVIFHDITVRRQAEDRLRESEAKYRTLIEQASDGIFISDARGRFVMVNTRGCELLGYEPGELVGKDGAETYLEEERSLHTRRMREIVDGTSLRFERMVLRKDGSAFPAEISVKKLDNGLVQVLFHDITERRAQEQKIARLSRIQAVLSGINSAIVRIHDRQALLEEACRIAALHGAFRIAAIGLRNQDGEIAPCAWAGDGADFFTSAAAEARPAASSPAGVAVQAIRQKRTVFDNDITRDPSIDPIRAAAVRDGCKSVIAMPLASEQEVVGVFVLYASDKDAFDAEEIKLLEELAGDVSFALTFIAQQEKVSYLAYYDSLTGLPNRSLFFDRLGRQLAAAEREGTGCVLALIDLDRFRMVNETLGRQAGDALIKAVAERLKESVRAEDTVARMGADRFAIVVSGNWATRDVTLLVEARSRSLFGTPFAIGAEPLRVAATAGVAICPADGKDAESLVANAEAALRNAKKQSVPMLFYSPEMNARAAESLRLESRLRQAITEQQLELWYQPKIDLHTRAVVAMEALMRWRDPQGGLVPPAKFIPVMEQTGMILDAGNWALSRVAIDCRQWKSAGVQPPRVAVNVSPIQLRQKDFVARVIEAAADAESAGGALDLEITESVIMENVEDIIPKLQTIRGLGVEIYVDDFGTGYSSLAYIARLPIHSLKIDRSFVVGMTQSEDSLNIVNSVISLAHSLKLTVVAEGVETDAQANLLKHLGCDQFQGYLVSKPLPPDEVPALLNKLP